MSRRRWADMGLALAYLQARAAAPRAVRPTWKTERGRWINQRRRLAAQLGPTLRRASGILGRRATP
jgi:hypothetical protein